MRAAKWALARLAPPLSCKKTFGKRLSEESYSLRLAAANLQGRPAGSPWWDGYFHRCLSHLGNDARTTPIIFNDDY